VRVDSWLEGTDSSWFLLRSNVVKYVRFVKEVSEIVEREQLERFKTWSVGRR